MAVDAMDVLDSLPEVEYVSKSSSWSEDCGLGHVEDVGLVVLLVLGVLGIALGELGVYAGCNGVLGIEGRFGIPAVGSGLCGHLMAFR